MVEQISCIFTQLQNIPVSKMLFPLLRSLTRHLLTLSPQHLQALFCIHRTETSESGRGGIHHTQPCLLPSTMPAPVYVFSFSSHSKAETRRARPFLGTGKPEVQDDPGRGLINCGDGMRMGCRTWTWTPWLPGNVHTSSLLDGDLVEDYS